MVRKGQKLSSPKVLNGSERPQTMYPKRYDWSKMTITNSRWFNHAVSELAIDYNHQLHHNLRQKWYIQLLLINRPLLVRNGIKVPWSSSPFMYGTTLIWRGFRSRKASKNDSWDAMSDGSLYKSSAIYTIRCSKICTELISWTDRLSMCRVQWR